MDRAEKLTAAAAVALSAVGIAGTLWACVAFSDPSAAVVVDPVPVVVHAYPAPRPYTAPYRAPLVEPEEEP